MLAAIFICLHVCLIYLIQGIISMCSVAMSCLQTVSDGGKPSLSVQPNRVPSATSFTDSDARLPLERQMYETFHFLPRDSYAKRGICRRRVSVCLSVTLRYCIKSAKRRITQTMPHDSPMTLVF